MTTMALSLAAGQQRRLLVEQDIQIRPAVQHGLEARRRVDVHRVVRALHVEPSPRSSGIERAEEELVEIRRQQRIHGRVDRAILILVDLHDLVPAGLERPPRRWAVQERFPLCCEGAGIRRTVDPDHLIRRDDVGRGAVRGRKAPPFCRLVAIPLHEARLGFDDVGSEDDDPILRPARIDSQTRRVKGEVAERVQQRSLLGPIVHHRLEPARITRNHEKRRIDDNAVSAGLINHFHSCDLRAHRITGLDP